MGDTELHPAGMWGAFYRAIENYRAFLQDAVGKGTSAVMRVHPGCMVAVSCSRATEQLKQCGQALERKYWTAPIDGDMSGLETFCRDQARQFPAFGDAVKNALLLEVGGLSRRLHEEGLREPDVSSVKRAIHEGLLLDDREKVVEGFLYARAAMDWYRAVIADAGAPVDQAEESGDGQRKPIGAKQPAIAYIRRRIVDEPEFEPLLEMKSGKSDCKPLKGKLWDGFQREFPELAENISRETFTDTYVREAVKPYRKTDSGLPA